MGKKVAIVGSGCSGLASLWALQSTDHEVHLFEAGSRLGGHTNTVTFRGLDGRDTQVDTGLGVMNTATHPNFIRFLNHVGIDTKRTNISFGVTRDGGDFEWSASSFRAMLAQKWSVLSLRRWRLVLDIIRFNHFALDMIINEAESDSGSWRFSKIKTVQDYQQLSMGQYLDQEGYSQTFKDDYLIPLIAMVCGTTHHKWVMQFPALPLIRIMWNHHLLNTITQESDWVITSGGSKQYIDAVMKNFTKERVHLNTRISAVIPEVKGKVILSANGEDLQFDHVILATGRHQLLELLKPVATKLEMDVLEGFRTIHNIAVLHSDVSLMPRNRLTWSACNVITESPFPPSSATDISKICLTYWMNQLQHIDQDTSGPILVTLNPLYPPATELTQDVWEYSHPLYDSGGLQLCSLLPTIQNHRGISYCGAWTRCGLHEDDFTSGLAVAQDHLDASLPFDLVDSTSSHEPNPLLTSRHHVIRLVIQIIRLSIMIIEVFSNFIISRLGPSASKTKAL